MAGSGHDSEWLRTVRVTATPESVGFSNERFGRIRTWVQGYIDEGKLPGAITMISRHGEIVFLECVGKSDLESDLEMQPDTIFRIYSMTKPIVSVGLMILCESGLLKLDDPLSDFLPMFRDMEVYRSGRDDLIRTEPAQSEISIRHLLTHTSGFCYGVFDDTLLASLYRSRQVEFYPDDGPLETVVKRLSGLPLLFHPGSRWNYGVSTDVLGHVIEVVSGQPLDVFLTKQVFEPLGMSDTVFHLSGRNLGRFSALYQATSENLMRLADPRKGSVYSDKVTTLSGGAGLLSTASDYFQFTEMIRRGGQGPEGPLLQPETIVDMTRNQLPGDLASMGQGTFNENSYNGIGFGLGFSVVINPELVGYACAAGEVAWGGLASTAFWVDPTNDLTVSFFTQLAPSDLYPIRWDLRNLVYRALTDRDL
jgi:CubicO group peptidase (beta-lactamase class C family)